MPDGNIAASTEPELKTELERRFAALGDRCVWRSEVYMLCFTHMSRSKADRLRIDYLIQLDGGPLVGVEVKAAPERAAELGQALFQSAQYSAGIVAPNTTNRIVPEWIGRPVYSVFLYTQWNALRDYVKEHMRTAHRLYGPANVGMLGFNQRDGMQLFLCGDRVWSETYGWTNSSIAKKKSRSGNGDFRP